MKPLFFSLMETVFRGWLCRWRRLPQKLEVISPRKQVGELRQSYPERVKELLSVLPEEEAVSVAVGGDYDFMGSHLVKVLKSYGLKKGDYLIDVGCGSGRVANALAKSELSEHIRYLGTDISEDLLRYAEKKCCDTPWRFIKVDSFKIPEEDEQVDMVCFFSVFTHLTPEESYLYLQEAQRVVKKDGVIVFTFFDFKVPTHWPLFIENIECLKANRPKVLDAFLSRDAVEVWAEKLGLRLEYVGSPDEGQSRCVLKKPRL